MFITQQKAKEILNCTQSVFTYLERYEVIKGYKKGRRTIYSAKDIQRVKYQLFNGFNKVGVNEFKKIALKLALNRLKKQGYLEYNGQEIFLGGRYWDGSCKWILGKRTRYGWDHRTVTREQALKFIRSKYKELKVG